MAYFLLIADHPKWPLYLVASYLDHGRRYVWFDLRAARKKAGKNMFMLCWSIDDKAIVPSTEWKQLVAYDKDLAQWALMKIENHMSKENIDVEIENGNADDF